MPESRVIDFLKGDAGWWILWVVLPLLLLIRLKSVALKGRGWRLIAASISKRLLAGLAIAALVNGLLAIWQRLPPQYFIRLKVEAEAVVIGFRWPKSDVVIPYTELKAVNIIRRKSLRRTRSRVELVAANSSYQSFGFGYLSPEEVDVLDMVRRKTNPGVREVTD